MPRVREAATETHQSIDQQVEAFLESGKTIQQIPHGTTGEPAQLPNKKGWRMWVGPDSGQAGKLVEPKAVGETGHEP